MGDSTATPPRPRVAKRVTRFFAAVEAHLSTSALLYLFLCFYAVAMILLFQWGFHGEIIHRDNIQLGPVMRYIIGMARGAGYTLNINTALVIILAARYMTTALRDTPIADILPLDKAFPMIHIVVGYTTAFAVLIHASFHFGWLFGWDLWQGGLWGFNMSVITGSILTVVFLSMVIYTRPSVRKNNFQLFYRVHIVGAVLFYPLLIIHGMYRNRPETYKYIVPALIVYLFDRVLRRLNACTTRLRLSSTNSLFKDETVLELRLPKPFSYQAGQYVELQVPSINREWHPFTIASAPYEQTLALYIKNLGDWTAELHEHFSRRMEGDDDSLLDVRVRGPYGAPAQHVQGYDRVVLISGGIGSTPFAAICKQLHHLQTHNESSSSHGDWDTQSSARAMMADCDTSVIEKKLYSAISRLYNVNVDTALNHISASDEQRSAFVTDMLQLKGAQENANVIEGAGDVTTDSEDTDSRVADSYYNDDSTMVDMADGDYANDSRNNHSVFPGKRHLKSNDPIFVSSGKAIPKARQKMIRLLDSRAHLMAMFHTTWMQFVLLLLLMVRVFVICSASIWNSTFVSVLSSQSGEEALNKGVWVVVVDTYVSAIVAFLISITVALEISYMGRQFFRRTARVLDLLLLVPTSITTVALNMVAYIQNEPLSNGLIALHYVVFLPIIFVLLLARLHGTLGGRRLTDTCTQCHCNLHTKIPRVDFVWTIPKYTDDLWLRQELQPLATDCKLTLHRYLTRETELDEEQVAEESMIAHTRVGRPNWDELFHGIAQRTKSNCTVGVFFCGPPAMGDKIRRSMKKNEVVSALKGAYLRSFGNKRVSSDAGINADVVKKLRAQGCSVRFSFREENF
ncbi:unnamed protein product [Agarophyton chilense]